MFWTNQFHLTLTSLYIIINPISFPLHFQTTAICRAVIALNPAAQTLVGLDAKTAIPVVRQLPLWLQEFLQRFQFGVRFLPHPAAVLAAKKKAAYLSPVPRGTGKEGKSTKTRTKKSKAK